MLMVPHFCCHKMHVLDIKMCKSTVSHAYKKKLNYLLKSCVKILNFQTHENTSYNLIIAKIKAQMIHMYIPPFPKPEMSHVSRTLPNLW